MWSNVQVYEILSIIITIERLIKYPEIIIHITLVILDPATTLQQSSHEQSSNFNSNDSMPGINTNSNPVPYFSPQLYILPYFMSISLIYILYFSYQ